VTDASVSDQAAATPAKPAPRSVAEIEGELDTVRARLAGRIDDLEAYVSPRSVAARQAEKARAVFVDEYGGIKPERVLMAVGVVVIMVGLGALRRHRRR
jgi:hypothetical protein